MSIQWRDRFLDLLSAPYSLFWIRGEKTAPSGPKAPEKPYQNPGKDKNHPGDAAAGRASTELPEGAPTKH
jgi:hypothetical protein